ncbi:MAG: hypothetical protein GXP28_02010 [Planctomycetes bacterium]|nr:hypothetical protein [Planctomycetota bacterium]
MVASSLQQENQSYKITNWRAHNASLVSRGDITVWFDEDVIDQWEHGNTEGRAGRPFVYSPRLLGTLGLLKLC